MKVNNPLAQSALVVGGFWWVLATVYAAWRWPHIFFSLDGFELIWSATYNSARFLIIGVVLASLGVLGLHAWRYFESLRNVGASSLRGMTCTIGAPPLPTDVIPQLEAIPEWFTDPTRVEHGRMLLDWIQANRERHPSHTALLETLIRALCRFDTLPASHVPGGHGGKSLLDHSARVAAMALKLAPSFRYEGLKTKYGSTPWRDADYRFDGGDPMIPIVGMAHDLGKLATFTIDASGQVTGSRPGHDKIGARLLAMMDETLALPAQDRHALYRAVANYHHPSDYPLTKEGRLDSDRTVALMMLLIQADKAAGKHEGQHFLPAAEYAAYLQRMRDLGEELDEEQLELIRAATNPSGQAKGNRPVPAEGEAAITDEKMLAAMIRILTDPASIARSTRGVDAQMIVGQLNTCDLPQYAWDAKEAGEELSDDQSQELARQLYRRVVLNEQKLRRRLAQIFGISSPSKRGDGRYNLTIQALRVLDQASLLDASWQDGFISPESAIFDVAFINRNSRKQLASWKAILVKPTGPLIGLATGDQHDSYFKVERPVWKDRRVRVGSSGDSDPEPAIPAASSPAVTDQGIDIDEPIEVATPDDVDTPEYRLDEVSTAEGELDLQQDLGAAFGDFEEATSLPEETVEAASPPPADTMQSPLEAVPRPPPIDEPGPIVGRSTPKRKATSRRSGAFHNRWREHDESSGG